MPHDDRELMCHFMETQDRRFLAVLYQRHHQPLCRFLFRLTRQRALAEDLAHQAWIKIIDAAGRGQYVSGESTFKSFLYTLARNTFLDECTRKHDSTRRRSLTESQFEQAVTDQGEPGGPEFEMQRSQSQSVLRQALDALPEEQRQVLGWWCGGESIVSMAGRARVPRDTVLSRKKYALAHLRRWLERSGAGVHAF
jgi:RNA polymerase sigma-70 factor (ECF subfamily)